MVSRRDYEHILCHILGLRNLYDDPLSRAIWLRGVVLKANNSHTRGVRPVKSDSYQDQTQVKLF
ncbi:uncharacterized protein PHALS_12852 [Plasmopara halstedii]|uniref:Uncharacterized protein n=1 Tax=Plasmopara halstedii TaxID=4781 RepID=A0A0P1ANM4_PLAHL|nr:uncharacterized protein PHALS_12852 [Plasmopara halstedii]CEG42590.1 hypothetical protein PHALS_12852 [Plasmopara halstedii]|eukprot:XP_024578959.1 hypothetical protein PHALS_12852 [Plasmopara halstedii]